MRIGSGVQSVQEVFGKRQNNNKTYAVHTDSGALDGITRKSVENERKSVDIELQIDLFMNCEVDLWESLFQIQEQLEGNS